MTTPPEQSRPLGIVTGASTGIGRALVDEFVHGGFDVLAVADEDLSGGWPESGPAARVRHVRADLATPGGNEKVVVAAATDGRPVVAAALNAGVGVQGRFDRTDLGDHLRLVAVNVVSPVTLAHHFLAQMTARREGRILITSSVAAHGPGPYQSTYAASKAFLHSFARALRHEVRGSGVSVTSLLPGPTATAFFGRADMEASWVARGPKADPSDVARQAFAAMMAGRGEVVTGSWLIRAVSHASTYAPEALATRLQAAVAKPRRRR